MIGRALGFGVAALGSVLAAPILAAPVAQAKPLPVRITLTGHGFGFRDIGFRTKSVRLEVRNRGSVPHGIAIYREPGGKRVAGTGAIKPGGSKTISFTLPPGRYRMASPVDHDAAHGFLAKMRILSPGVKGGGEMNRVFYDY